MADYEFRYRLMGAPQARNDGSGFVDHQIVAIYREQGSGLDWNEAPIVPGRNRTISLEASEIQAALAAGNNGAIASAYKDYLVTRLGFIPDPVLGWSLADLEQKMDNDDAAAQAASDADTWIMSVVGSYPATFQL